MNLRNFVVQSSRGATNLRLSSPEPPGLNYPVTHFRATLEDRDLPHSSAKIFIHEPYDLVEFFKDLAAQMGVWEGEKQWQSVERDLTLACRANGDGIVAMSVTLKSGVWEEDWCARALLHVRAKQFDELAAQIKDFLHAQII